MPMQEASPGDRARGVDDEPIHGPAGGALGPKVMPATAGGSGGGATARDSQSGGGQANVERAFHSVQLRILKCQSLLRPSDSTYPPGVRYRANPPPNARPGGLFSGRLVLGLRGGSYFREWSCSWIFGVIFMRWPVVPLSTPGRLPPTHASLGSTKQLDCSVLERHCI